MKKNFNESRSGPSNYRFKNVDSHNWFLIILEEKMQGTKVYLELKKFERVKVAHNLSTKWFFGRRVTNR